MSYNLLFNSKMYIPLVFINSYLHLKIVYYRIINYYYELLYKLW